MPDVNLLVYAYNATAPYHRQAAGWWQNTINSADPVGVCWPVLQSFVRLLSGRSIVTSPYPLEELFQLCQEWWDHRVQLIGPSVNTLGIFQDLCLRYQTVGASSSDSLIAAFALEHRARLATNDTDFLRFTELKTFNPLK